MIVYKNPIVVLSLSLLMFGFCSNKITSPARPDLPTFPVTVGIVADSQITTDKETYNYVLRSRWSDKVASVAIRPAALEYLAPELLEQLVQRLLKKKAEVILYLGDAANSGCTDELNKVFTILKKYQKKVPIYFVIGNHDYLGMGNMTRPDVRSKVCQTKPGQNPPLHKYAVMQIISKFNHANARFHGNKFAYQDSMPIMQRRYRKHGSGVNDHYHYYLAGKLEHKTKDNARVQFLFVDTSDYKDINVDYKIGKKTSLKRIGVYGEKAGISFKGPESQVQYLKRIMSPKQSKQEPHYRILASHYPPNRMTKLGWNCKWYKFKIKQQLLSLRGKNKNYWLTAHSHIKRPTREVYKVGFANKQEFVGLNTGSTSDFQPHVVLFGAKRNAKIDDKVGYTMLPLQYRQSYCRSILKFIDNDFQGNRKICNFKRGRAVYGMDKSYKQLCWNKSSRASAVHNLEALIARFIKYHKGTRAETVACIGNHASKKESEKVIFENDQLEDY